MTEFDVDFAREQYPELRAGSASGWAYFENAGGSLAPVQVIGKLQRFFEHTKVQPYYPYAPSEEAGAAMDRSHEVHAALMNAAPGEIHFGPSTTMNVYVLAHALREQMREGDEIIVTDQDHEANIGAWRRLESTGIAIREWQADARTGLLNTEDLDGLLSERTRLVCMTHCSNVAAQVMPVRAIADKVHAAGARLAVDGVSFAPHGLVDVRALDVDFYYYSLYKTYGPHLGMLYVRESLLADIPNQGHFFNAGFLNKRLVPAGPDHGEIACASGIADYYAQLHAHHWGETNESLLEQARKVFRLFGAHEESLARRVLEFLTAKDSVRLIGSADASHDTRAPTIAFVSERCDNEAIVRRMSQAKIGCGYGNFYAYRLIQRLGLDADTGVTRLSLVHYNTHAEVDRALEVLDSIL